MCLCTRIVLVRAAYRHVPYAVRPVAALVIIGIQVLLAAWIIYIRIRAPD